MNDSNARDCPKCGTQMRWKHLIKARCMKCEPFTDEEKEKEEVYREWKLRQLNG